MTVLIPGRNIVLVGMMGAGKSTVGRLLAERLARPYADTDELVETETGQPVNQVFAERGERAFREIEAEVIRRVTSLKGQVISAGGGAVLLPGNVTNLHATGDVVYLRTDPATLAERLDDTDPATRPLLAEADDLAERLAEILDRRQVAYERAATHTLDTAGKTPEELADALLEWAMRKPGLLAREERAT